LANLLSNNGYPGRGLINGTNRSGSAFVQVYWVMGRSKGSQNRILFKEGDLVKTRPFESAGVGDASLTIYTAIRTVGNFHIATNGDQTDTIAGALEKDGSFIDALLTRAHEPDPPLYTPRISSVLDAGDGSFWLSRIGKSPYSGDSSVHAFYHYGVAPAGEGICFHTYVEDGNPPPAYNLDPYGVTLGETAEEIAVDYWGQLNEANRVGLVAKTIDAKSGAISLAIRNRHG
jgi:IMP cyclohydrolase